MKSKEKFNKVIKCIRDFFKWLFFGKSLLSYVAFVIFSFVLIKFVVYPVIYKIFNLSYMSAILSGSMTHGDYVNYTYYYWLEINGYNVSEVKNWPFPNGINVGDVIFARKERIKVGDVIVYKCVWKGCPKGTIVHRVINITKNGNVTIYHTKGDANPYQLYWENNISENLVVGKVIYKVPYLGYPRYFVWKIFGI